MFAEFWRHAAQRCLAARKPDRRGYALVPVLFDHIATMDGVGIGQRLVDRLHRSGGQAGIEQPVAQWFAVVLTEHRFEFGAKCLAIGYPILVAREARIGAEFRLADLLAQLAEGAVIADAGEDVAVAGRKDRIRHEIRVLLSRELRRISMR